MTEQEEIDKIVAEAMRRDKDRQIATVQPLTPEKLREIEESEVPEEILKKARDRLKRLRRPTRTVPTRGTIPAKPEDVGLEPDDDLLAAAIGKPTVTGPEHALTMMKWDMPRPLKEATYEQAIEFIKYAAPVDPQTAARAVPFFEAELVNRAVRTALFHVRLAETGRKWDKTNTLRALAEAHFVAADPKLKINKMERDYAIGSLEYLRWIVEKMDVKKDFGLVHDAFNQFLKNWDMIAIQMYEREK